MSKISATVLTLNAGATLQACLKSLSRVADEIVVVDSYSTDNTLDICRSYGCKVKQRPFSGFGSQRQYALSLTTHSYVLSVDADEVLSDELCQAILRLKESPMEHRVYSLRVVQYFCGRPMTHSGWEPDMEIRLFNKRFATWNLLDLSERVSFPDTLTPYPMEGCIHHYRCATVSEFETKENRRASISARNIAATGRSINRFTPRLRALGAFLDCYLMHSAWRDGRPGHSIARRRFRTTLLAYNMARQIMIHHRNITDS